MLIPLINGEMMLTPEQVIDTAHGAEKLRQHELAVHLDNRLAAHPLGRTILDHSMQLSDAAFQSFLDKQAHEPDFKRHVVAVGPYSTDMHDMLSSAYEQGIWLRMLRPYGGVNDPYLHNALARAARSRIRIVTNSTYDDPA